MVLFVGDMDKGYYVGEVCQDEVCYTGNVSHAAELEHYVLKENYSQIVIDLEQFVDHYDKVAAEMERLQNVAKSQFIFVGKGYSEKTNIVSALMDRGFTLFVTAAFTGPAKEELRNALENKPRFDPVIKAVKETKPVETANPNQKSIAVAGCSHRIGCSTQVFQICKYLMLHKQKVCIVSTQKDVLEWKTILDIQQTRDDEQLARLVIDGGIDVYTDPDKIAVIKAMGYDYIVYDMGEIHEPEFMTSLYMEKDFRIVVAGVKPGEMSGVDKALDYLVSDTTYFIFSFISDDTKESILSLQGTLADHTRFACYTPDPFVYVNAAASVYDDIFPMGKHKEKQVEKKRKGLFGKKQN